MSEIVETIKKKMKGQAAQAVPAKPASMERVYGFVYFLIVLFALSLASRLGFEPRVRVFLAGEIATHDVASDQSFQIEDLEATSRKRDQVAESQPPVFDQSPLVVADLRRNVTDILNLLRGEIDDDPERVRWQISEKLNAEAPGEMIDVWRREDFQNLMSREVLPWLEDQYDPGVVGSTGVFGPHKSGVLIRDLSSRMETLKVDTRGIKDLRQVREDLEHLLRNVQNRPLRVRKAVYDLVFPFMAPNLTLNQETTQARKKDVMSAIEPLYYNVKKGEIIVRQGERVGPSQQLKLQALYRQQTGGFQYVKALGVFSVCLLFLLVLHFSLDKRGIAAIGGTDWIFLGTVVLLFGLLAKAGDFVSIQRGGLNVSARLMFFSHGLPLAGAAGILALFFSKRLCIFISLILSYLASNMVGGDLNLFCYYFIGSMVFIFLVKRSETRPQILRATIPLAATLGVMWLSTTLLDGLDPATAGMGLLFVTLSALLSLLLVLGLAPLMELLFGYSSRFRLMELLNLEQPLLQELMVNAPGTYHHSLIVSNMVEAGARAIGANALLAKVAALYHDIGKLKNPRYFIENISCRENRHDKLTPSMSALILISHVKKGVDLAREHKLGPVLTDLIRQHHGTSLIAYFYHKARELAAARGEDAPREEEFRYPGPKPQSKEAGLILLADAIEASSRTLVDPTPSRIRNHILGLVRKIFTEGELDESQLTLKDVTLLTDTFQRILTGIFHQRIEYPSIDRTRGGKPRETAPAERPRESQAARDLAPAEAPASVAASAAAAEHAA